MRRLILVSALFVPAAAAAVAAAAPSALANVSGGLWEVTGAPGANGPVRQCVGDVLALAQFEHRGKNCSRSIVSDRDGSEVISYTCGGAGFGRSQVDVITARSLRISTQGISDQLPFNYVLQARRIGDCAKSAPSSSHH